MSFGYYPVIGGDIEDRAFYYPYIANGPYSVVYKAQLDALKKDYAAKKAELEALKQQPAQSPEDKLMTSIADTVTKSNQALLDFMAERDGKTKALAEAQEKIKTLETQGATDAEKIAKLEAEVEKLNGLIAECRKEIEELESENADHLEQIEKLETQQVDQALKDRIKTLEAQCTMFEEKIAKAEAMSAALYQAEHANVEAAKADIERLRKARDDIERKWCDDKRFIKELENEVSGMHAKLDKVQCELDAEKARGSLDGTPDGQTAHSRIKYLEEEVTALHAMLATRKVELVAAEKDVRNTRAFYFTAKEKLSAAEDQIAEYKDKIADLERQLAEKSRAHVCGTIDFQQATVLGEAKAKIKELEEALKARERQAFDAKAECDNLKIEHERKATLIYEKQLSLEHQLRHRRAKLDELEALREKMEEEARERNENIAELHKICEGTEKQLQETIEKKKEQRAKYEREIADLRAKLEGGEQSVVDLQVEISDKNRAIAELEMAVEEKTVRLKERDDALEQVRGNLEAVVATINERIEKEIEAGKGKDRCVALMTGVIREYGHRHQDLQSKLSDAKDAHAKLEMELATKSLLVRKMESEQDRLEIKLDEAERKARRFADQLAQHSDDLNLARLLINRLDALERLSAKSSPWHPAARKAIDEFLAKWSPDENMDALTRSFSETAISRLARSTSTPTKDQ